MQYLFLFIILFLLFLVHYMGYRFFIFTFCIKRKIVKRILIASLGILSISFIASAILSHTWPNFFTEILYLVSGLWYGFIANLTIAIDIFLVLIGLSILFKFSFNKLIASRVFLGLAILFTIHGVYCAFSPVLKNVTVSIKDLPDNWENKIIVQLSDMHLGKILGVRFANRVNAKIAIINPEIVVITGDLFDGMDGNLAPFIKPLNNIKAKEGVFFVTGNHEAYIGLDETLGVLGKTKIKVLDDEVALVNGLQIIGVSYPSLEKDIKADINFSSSTASILLFHPPTDIKERQVDHGESYFSPNVNFNTAIDLGVDLQLSGHTHKGQIFPFNFMTKFLFDGYDYGLHSIGDFNLFTSSGTGFWGPAMRTGSRSEIVVITLKRK